MACGVDRKRPYSHLCILTVPTHCIGAHGARAALEQLDSNRAASRA